MTDPEQVVEANLKFYFALESLDVNLMEEVWATDGSAICVHPNWSRLAGWENIRASWEQIFRNTSFMRVDVSEVPVKVQNNVAWVTCLENIHDFSSRPNPSCPGMQRTSSCMRMTAG
jgi:ketosteroid isomerase-like protein